METLQYKVQALR